MNNKAFTMSLAMALAAVFMIYSYIQSREEEWAKRYGEESTVVIAKRDINELENIREDMLTTKVVPKEYQIPGVFAKPSEIINIPDGKDGKPALFIAGVALVPIRKGEQISRSKVGEVGMRTGVARQVTPGKRAMSLSVSEVTGVSKLMKPGDRIDLIAIVEPPGSSGKGNHIARTVMQDVPLLAVGKFVSANLARRVERDENGKDIVRSLHENDSYSTVTVEVAPPDAQLLAYLASVPGILMTVSLRNNDDTERVVLPATTMGDVLGSDATKLPRAPASK